MSSSYINNFIGEIRPKFRLSDDTQVDYIRAATIEVVDDFEKNDALKHFKKRFVADRLANSVEVNWKKRYVTSNYMQLVLSEYVGYIETLNDLDKTFMHKKNGAVDQKKLDVFLLPI